MCLHRRPPPPFGKSSPGEKIDKQKKKNKKKGLQHEKVERLREIGALESSGPIAYATLATRLIQHTAMKSLYLFALFKIRPYKLSRRPLQGLCPRAMAPPAPLATPLVSILWSNLILSNRSNGRPKIKASLVSSRNLPL